MSLGVVVRALCLVVLHLGSVVSTNRASVSESRLTQQCIREALFPQSVQCQYPPITQSQALIEMRDKWIVFMGESTLRQMFLQFIATIDESDWDRIPDQKSKLTIEIRRTGSRFTFMYLPYYNNITTHLLDPPRLFDGRAPDLLVLNDGLHDLLYAPKQMDKAWKTLATSLKQHQKTYGTPVIFIPPGFMHDSYLTKHRKTSEWFRNSSIATTVTQQRQTIESIPNAFFFNVFKNVSFPKWNFDGVHHMKRARYEAEAFIGSLHWLNEDTALWGGYYHHSAGQSLGAT